MELGKTIRQLRLKAGFTQEQLAEKMGVGPQAVSKWENAAAMPDITLLPLLAETFGVTLDDLFGLTAEQRLNRIENRMDIEKELPPEVFREYEDFLKARMAEGADRERVTELTAYLYWHRMNADAEKVRRYAKEAIRMKPNEKGCQWMLHRAEGHAAWDWNVANHRRAVDFYRELAQANPGQKLPLCYLLDNLIADRRADEAERYLERLRALPDADPVMTRVYRAYIALARFDEPKADAVMEQLRQEYGEDSRYLFEAAQYYARKCDYQKAIECYELSFSRTPRRPRYQDELQGIAEIYEIQGEYRQAADTWERIVSLLRDEWGFTEETELQDARREKARLLARAHETADGSRPAKG